MRITAKRNKHNETYMTLKKQEAITGYLLRAPNSRGTLIFVILPLILTLLLSFSKWDFIKGLYGLEFVGLDNYKRMMSDPKVWEALKNNLFFSFTQIPVTVILALIISSVMYKYVYMKTFLRTIYFIPFITSWVSASLVFKALFEPQSGPVNSFLKALGVSNPPGWFVDMNWSMISIIILTIWHTVGYYMVILLSGMQSISQELYESAKIDGANAWQRYFRITLPLLTPSLFFIFIMSMINSLKVFDQVAVATQGGPGTSSYVLVYAIYDYAFNFFDMGYASAIAWLLFVVILVFTLVQWKGQDKWVNYDV